MEKGRSSKTGGRTKYGELIVLGYNGSLPTSQDNRRRSKYVIYRRSTGNGVRPHRMFTVKNSQDSSSVKDSATHSVCYTLSKNKSVVVEYAQDGDTDMFQLGRSSDSQIDLIVNNTVPAAERHADAAQPSTISRYACRVVVDRCPPYTPRIYAAGFDQWRNIFLGEKAKKWYSGKERDEIDGLTTNGVWILQPPEGFHLNDKCAKWREVSVGGYLYPLRDDSGNMDNTGRITDEENILSDGTLIDLCGAVLLWRGALGLLNSPTHDDLQRRVAELNAARPQCPVGYNTLVISGKAVADEAGRLQNSLGSSSSQTTRQPYVYLNCGHVHGQHDWGQMPGTNGAQQERQCPVCRSMGPFVRLEVAVEPSLYTDTGPLTHCFNPCAHIASEQTVKYWARIKIHDNNKGFKPICPFCATVLQGPDGFVKLIFQDNID